jgi:uncharacterized protein YukE
MAVSNDKLSVILEAQVNDFVSAFKQAQNTVNNFASEASSSIRNATSNIKGRFDRLTNSIFSVKGALVSLGAAFSAVKFYDFIKGSEEAFQSQQRADAALRQAMISMGRYSDTSYKSMLQMAGALQKTTGFEDDNIETGLKFLMTYRTIGNDVMPEVIKTMTDLAALMGGDMRQAANMLGKASMGMTGELRRVGITVDDNTFKSQGFIGVLKQIEQQVSGQAETFRNTQMGGLQAFGNAIGDLREEIGRFSSNVKYLLAESLIPVVEQITGEFQNNTGAINQYSAMVAEGILQAVRDTISGAEALVQAIKPAYEAITSIFGIVLDGFNSLPDFLKEVGIVGVLLLGTKGRLVIASALAAISVVEDLINRLPSGPVVTQQPGGLEGYGGTPTGSQNPFMTPIDLNTGQQIKDTTQKTNNILDQQNGIVGALDKAIANLKDNWQGILDKSDKAASNMKTMNNYAGGLNTTLQQTNKQLSDLQPISLKIPSQKGLGLGNFQFSSTGGLNIPLSQAAQAMQFNADIFSTRPTDDTGLVMPPLTLSQQGGLGLGNFQISQLDNMDVKLSNATEHMKFSMDDLNENFNETTNDISKRWAQMADTMTADFSRLFVDMVEGRITSFADFALGMLGTIAGEFMNMGMGIMMQPVKTAMGNWLGGLFGGGKANGGVLKGGFRAFASGGVATGPTLGLIGEGKYNEAVVPLPDGKNIPVKMANSGTTVQIINNAGVNTDVQKETVDGREVIKVFLSAVTQDILKNGQVGKSIRDTFGLRR